MESAFNYIHDHNIGIEDDYPYRAADLNCQRNDQGWRLGITGYYRISCADVLCLSNDLHYQPISVALEVNQDFMHYSSGVFTADASCGNSLNHAVLLVGQNDNYYVVKNSWSENWGESGYIRMQIGSGRGTCGIANMWDVAPYI